MEVEVVVSAVVALITGAMASLIAPWAVWGVEKRRLRYSSRKELVRDLRDVLLDPPDRNEFRLMPVYSRIRPHLSKNVIETIEPKTAGLVNEAFTVSIGQGRHSGINQYSQLLLDDIARIEKKWSLI